MERRYFWCITYISVLSMRYHPRNDGGEDVLDRHRIAFEAAQEALVHYDLACRARVGEVQ